MAIDRTIIIASIIIIILCLVFFLVMPQYNQFKDLQQQLGEKMTENARQKDYYSAIEKIYYDLQSRKEDLAKIDSALPKESDSGKTIYFLQQTAKSNGLMTKNLFLSKTSGGGSQANANIVKSIFFSMDLEGDYPSLLAFMRELESSSRIFEITNISFSSSANPPYNFSLQIKTNSY